MEKTLMTAHSIAVLGTASDVGKSIVATALCRIFRDAGIDVAPSSAEHVEQFGCDAGRVGDGQGADCSG